MGRGKITSNVVARSPHNPSGAGSSPSVDRIHSHHSHRRTGVEAAARRMGRVHSLRVLVGRVRLVGHDQDAPGVEIGNRDRGGGSLHNGEAENGDGRHRGREAGSHVGEEGHGHSSHQGDKHDGQVVETETDRSVRCAGSRPEAAKVVSQPKEGGPRAEGTDISGAANGRAFEVIVIKLLHCHFEIGSSLEFNKSGKISLANAT